MFNYHIDKLCIVHRILLNIIQTSKSTQFWQILIYDVVKKFNLHNINNLVKRIGFVCKKYH